MKVMLAIDIGASSGRIIKGWIENNKLKTEELFRFSNGFSLQEGHYVWNYDSIFSSIIEGLKKVDKTDDIVSLAIDTWGVDFVLLDENKQVIGQTISYRDSRTDNILSPISLEDLYKRTGIQYLNFNTIYQLLAVKQANPEYIEKAKYFLQVPDYLNFLLTGIIEQEYTNATTTNLVDAKERTWDYPLLEKLGLPSQLFKTLSQPGSIIGNFTKEVEKKIGFNTKVIHSASHDTASAVFGMPLGKSSAFLATGTWSILGCELTDPILNSDSLNGNFSNEGGVEKSIRFLKNLSGLWIFQCLSKELNLSYAQIESQANRFLDTKYRFDITLSRLTNPVSMKKEILTILAENSIFISEDGMLFAVVYQSLTDYYASSLSNLIKITNTHFDNLVMVGGGTKDKTLCSLTEQKIGIPLIKGPQEGTAIGNLLSQAIGNGIVTNKQDARALI